MRDGLDRNKLLALLVTIAALAALPRGAAADLDVSVRNGAVVDAQLAPAGEVETYRVTLVAGAKLSVTLKAKPESKKAAPVTPGLAVLDGDGATVATGAAKGKSVKVRHTAGETGEYRIVVTGDGGVAGAYQLKVKWKSPKKVRREVALPAGPGGATFDAEPGSVVSLKAKSAKGSPALPRLARLASGDLVFDYTDFTPPKPGSRSHKAGRLALSSSQRTYDVTLDNDGEAGGVVLDVKLKAPKASKISVDLRDASLGGGDSPGASGGKPAVAFGGVIGPEGGSASVADSLGGIVGGAGISVPAGALTSPVAITFGAAVNPLPVPDAGLNELGPTVFFGPEGLSFGSPATITIPFDVGALAGGTDGVEVFARDEDGSVTRIPPPYVFDLDAGTCSFPASHFTSFRAFAGLPPFTLENERIVVPTAAAAGDRVGAAVALDANTLVIGAPGDDTAAAGAGAVYVYVRSGSSWSLQATITASDASASAEFGSAVAIAGDSLVVGAPGARSQSLATGAVYEFGRFQGQWTEFQRFIGSQTNNADRFGASLDYDGTTLVVGAPGESSVVGPANAGAAYVFELLDGLIETQRVTQSNAASGERFGSAVALATSDRFVIGAPGTLVPGRAFVFDRDPQQQFGSAWSQTAELLHGEAAGEEDFGGAVAADGDVVVVADPAFDVDGTRNTGAAFVFALGATWAKESRIAALSPSSGERFGTSVAVLGDIAAAGVPGRDLPGASGAGAVDLFGRAAGSWPFAVTRAADTPVLLEGIGEAVVLSGGEAVFGGTGVVQSTGTVLTYDVVLPPLAKRR